MTAQVFSISSGLLMPNESQLERLAALHEADPTTRCVYSKNCPCGKCYPPRSTSEIFEDMKSLTMLGAADAECRDRLAAELQSIATVFTAEIKRYDPDDNETADFDTLEGAFGWLYYQQRYGACAMWINNERVSFFKGKLIFRRY